MIECRNVIKEYFDEESGYKVRALDSVNLKIEKNEFVSLVGPSGCGKTTLLNIISGFDKPTEGSVFFEGKLVEKPSSKKGVVFQETSIFPWLSSLENIMFGLEIKGYKKKDREEIAKKYLGLVRLKGFDHAYPHELSGGMKQKVAIARTLAMNPDVLLMDEPFSSLDEQTRNQLDFELMNIWQQEKKTVVFVTHSIQEAIILSDRVVLMTARPGRVQKEFKIDIPRPRNIFSNDVIELHKKMVQNMMLCCK